MKNLLYPIYPRKATCFERLALRLGTTIGFCTVCGQVTALTRWQTNFRETGCCVNCRAINRHRQIAAVVCIALREWKGIACRALAEINAHSDWAIFNTESAGALHRYLSRLPGYVCSEYWGSQYMPGEVVNGVRNENLTCLSFPNDTFDFVISSEVLEHIPEPYRAHREIFRVLRPGGQHIFTVPFHSTSYRDDVRAIIEDGEIKMLQPPIYHGDPLRANGILVYTIFSLEMLLKLNEIGFRTRMYLMYNPTWGILGSNGIVFQSIKEVES